MPYSALFQKGIIGNLELKNRIFMAAMGNALADPNGGVTDAMLDYYRARARGGVSMVITQLVSITREDVMPYNLAIYDDSFIPGISRLVQAIHDQGSRVCVQLMHPGMLFLLLKNLPAGTSIKIPNLTPEMPQDRQFKVMTTGEIEACIQAFAAAARRAREAGADAVELHACHGCLLSTFLTPAINRRNDEYGGSIENRTRFVSLAVKEIKAAAGAEFPLTVRINGCDDVEGGVTPEEVVEQSKILAASGANAISISSGLEYWSTLMAPSYLTPEGIILPVAEKVRKATGMPVIIAGKIPAVLAAKTIGENKADYVALGRPLLADPELPNKLGRNQPDEMARCLYCNNCLRTSWRSCTVNPFVYRESAASLTQTARPKKVMVIGGGLAGMEAALLFKRCGHSVSLYEKEGVLGGQWKIASTLPEKQGYQSILEYLETSLKKLQVPVNLGAAMTREKIAEIKPDMVIIATGAVPAGLDVPGASGPQVVQANDIITGKAVVRGRAAVIGGSQLAMETAAWLAGLGNEIALISHSGLGGRKGPDDMITFRGLLRKLVQYRVPMYLNAAIAEITPKAVKIVWSGESITVPAETVILAVGVKPVDGLVRELKGLVPEIYPVGDCVMPGNAAQATYSAARLAQKVA